jgi:hypothetical protein
MIYTVECSFADPAYEKEWNDFYSLEKLPALISVSGFHTSQRFKALSAACPVYLAVHSIDDMAVLESDEYQRKGGGNFARWQQHIIDWHRNLYDGTERAPAIGEGEHLILSEVGAEPIIDMGLTPVWMQAAALEKCPENRWLAKLDRATPLSLNSLAAGVHLYAPLTAQLTGGSSAKAPATEPNQHA